MKNKIEDVRNHLFATLEGLLDADEPMDIARAKAVADVAQVIINSAKVESDYLKVINATGGTGFIPAVRELEDTFRKGRIDATGI